MNSKLVSMEHWINTDLLNVHSCVYVIFRSDLFMLSFVYP